MPRGKSVSQFFLIKLKFLRLFVICHHPLRATWPPLTTGLTTNAQVLEFTSSMGIFHRSFLSRISCLLIFLCSGCFIYVYFVNNHELFGSRRGTTYHLR